jgi:hypothetical protein
MTIGQVALAGSALLAVQVTVVVIWVKYGDWLMIVLYIFSAVKTAPGVSMGAAAVEVNVVEETLLLLSSWPAKVSEHFRS